MQLLGRPAHLAKSKSINRQTLSHKLSLEIGCRIFVFPGYLRKQTINRRDGLFDLMKILDMISLDPEFAIRDQSIGDGSKESIIY